MKEMCTIVETKSPEEKEYLICYKALANSGESDGWVIVEGRSNAYEEIISFAAILDFANSFILVETCRLSERISLYKFMKHCEQFYGTKFNVDDYIDDGYDGEDTLREVDESLLVSESDIFTPITNESIIVEDIEGGEE